MQVAPIRSPIEMLRAQERLVELASSEQGTPGEIESRGLRDAIQHYCCITEASHAKASRPATRPAVIHPA